MRTKQVWFPGSHMDVGGGHRETGLSDGALQWMIERAEHDIKLDFHPSTTRQIPPDPDDLLHDDDRTALGWLRPSGKWWVWLPSRA
ncbi:phospholipase effector Tle1 domain-containing protein [Streptomyces sp. NPDC056165]|uniref:phospholipase effector Tle1 domain-containing protein n=1 Tax=Streptomyces sp. NPDC056165 TaxID=3345733 RepID=UPI0035DA74A6